MLDDIDHPQNPAENQIQHLVKLYNQGKLGEVFEQTSTLTKQYHNSLVLWNLMGASAAQIGQLDDAVHAFQKALSIKPDYAEAYNNMGVALTGVIFTKPNKDIQKTIVSLLDKEIYIRPSDIADSVISLLKLEANLQKHVQLVDGDFIQNPVDVISDISELPLLLEMMSICPLPDLELEQLFTNLRCSILSNISSLKEASAVLLRLQSALALQCCLLYTSPSPRDS